MKAHRIQAVIFAGLENLLPRFNVGCGITGQRKITAEMRAANINRVAVQEELIAVGAKLMKAENNFTRVIYRIAF